MEIGEFLKRWRKERGWTQTKLAGELGLTRAGLWKLESGGSTPSDATLREISRVCKTSMTRLWGHVLVSKRRAS